MTLRSCLKDIGEELVYEDRHVFAKGMKQHPIGLGWSEALPAHLCLDHSPFGTDAINLFDDQAFVLLVRLMVEDFFPHFEVLVLESLQSAAVRDSLLSGQEVLDFEQVLRPAIRDAVGLLPAKSWLAAALALE